MRYNIFFRGCSGVMVVLALLAFFLVGDAVRPLAIEGVTSDMILPYLEARIVVEGWGKYSQFKNCEKNNFDEWPWLLVTPKSPTLERLASYTLILFQEDRKRISMYVPLEELNRFNDGDSPRGVFRNMALKEAIRPYFEKAKAGTIAYRDKEMEVAAQKTQAQPPS